MPKIKVKNIPENTYKRICTNCIRCSRVYCFQFDTVKIPNGRIHVHHDVVELSEQEFPTNREWMESLSNEDLATFLTTGLLIHGGKYDGLTVTNALLIPDREDMLDWLSQPCKYLEEE